MSNAVIQSNWIPDTSSFAARLALVRWRMGWNIREAERECHLSQNSWAGYESGRDPRKFVEVVNRITLRTGVDRMWLMTGEGSPEPVEGPTPTVKGRELGRPMVDLVGIIEQRRIAALAANG